MIFGEIPLDQATGAILAHSLRLPGSTFKKGRCLSALDIVRLAEAGRSSVMAARLEPGDVGEDEAARQIATGLAGAHLRVSTPFTGRCNLHAMQAGLVLLDTARLDRLNAINEAATVATLAPFDLVNADELVATIKIIPFAVPAELIDACLALAVPGGAAISLAPLGTKRIGLIQTVLPGTKRAVLEKTVDATRLRLSALGATLLAETHTPHEIAPLASAIAAMLGAGAEIVLIAGASAITDRLDVVPAAIVRQGGAIEHLGMPVDPGNLLLLARIDHQARSVPILGLPGCARSPKINGVDWVLRRLVADLPLTGADIMRMGVGGLLKEIPMRPQPRAGIDRSERPASAPPRIAALVLAAGRSTRMGAENKLLAFVDGQPMLARTVDAVAASQAWPILVVVGHDRTRVEEVLAGREVTFVPNPDYAEGISTSLRHGLAALPTDVDGVVVCLGDMPRVDPRSIDRLIGAFEPSAGRTICVPVHGGKRGNPVLWGRRHFPEMGRVSGDTGAKHLIGEHADELAEIPVESAGVLIDVDTPDALAALGEAGGS